MSLILTTIGAVGAFPVIFAALLHLERFRRTHRVLRFKRKAPIDVVLTTSTVLEHDVGVVVSRPITGYGQVTGLVSCVKLLSARYRKKELRVHLSGFIRNRIERDLVCLGGPVRNQATREVLAALDADLDQPTIKFDDVKRTIEIKDPRGSFSEVGFDPGVDGGAPATDLALVIAANRRATADGVARVVVCAGFTTYGTAAAAEYMFSDLTRMRGRIVRRLVGGPRLRWSGEFVVVLRARFSRGECIEMSPVYGTTLRRKDRG